MSLLVSFFVDQLLPVPTDVLFEWRPLDVNCILSKNELAAKVTSSYLGEGNKIYSSIQLFISSRKPNKC